MQIRNRVPAARPRPGCRVAIGSPSTKQAESMELRLCAGGALAATPRWRLILSSCGSAFDTAATPRLSHGNVADMRWAMVYPVPVMRRPVTGGAIMTLWNGMQRKDESGSSGRLLPWILGLLLESFSSAKGYIEDSNMERAVILLDLTKSRPIHSTTLKSGCTLVPPKTQLSHSSGWDDSVLG